MNYFNSIYNSIESYSIKHFGKNEPYLLLFSWWFHIMICILCINYNPYHLSFQYTLNINIFDIYLNFGIDGFSFFFIYLISFLLPLCLLHIYYTNTSETQNLYAIALF